MDEKKIKRLIMLLTIAKLALEILIHIISLI